MRRRTLLGGLAGAVALAPGLERAGLGGGIIGPAEAAALGSTIKSKKARFKVTRVVGGLDHPWGLVFLPDGSMLVSERPGRLRHVKGGRLDKTPVPGLPRIYVNGEAGLLDLCLHPGYRSNGLLYFTFASGSASGASAALGRARFDGKKLIGATTLLRATPDGTSTHHYGSRVVFGHTGNFLYMSTGERYTPGRAQDLGDLGGKILHLDENGRAVSNNPFYNKAGARPEIWTYGHRDPQGLAVQPGTGRLYSTEHGPKGGDEVNAIDAGANYGWPLVTYGTSDGEGESGTEGTSGPGFTEPAYYWAPTSVAPSGCSFYSAGKFPGWKNNLFVACLAAQSLIRLEIGGNGKVTAEERLITGLLGRLRHVVQGPDGLLYVLTDAQNGGIYKISPA